MKVIISRASAVFACAIVLSACSSGSNSAMTPSVSGNGNALMHPAGSAAQRSIGEFVAAQGTFCFPEAFGVPAGADVVDGCVIFVPPVKNFEGWGDPKTNKWCPVGVPLAAVDYAGLANQYIVNSGGTSLGTSFTGTITERPLSNGTAEVVVNLHTKNALAWGGCDPAGVPPSNFNFVTSTLMFGNKAPAVLAGAPPALATSEFQVKFVEPQMGAPMPDLLQLLVAPLPGQAFENMKFHASADGVLQSAYGVPAGTRGQLVVVETATNKTVGKAAGDGFTAETIQISSK